MSGFNFGSLASTNAVSNAQQILKPWGIYTVKFMGARKDTIQGVKDPTQTYEILRVRFENNDGYYEESIFYPKEGDDKRPTYTSKDGHEYEGASSFERTMTFIAQVANALNPEGFKKMQAASSKFKNFEQVVKAFIQVTNPAIGKETHLKIIEGNRNGNIISKLPKFVAVNKSGELFTCDNFIGDKLFFTNYEKNKMSAYQNATPTSINSSEPKAAATTTASADDDLDFDSLL